MREKFLLAIQKERLIELGIPVFLRVEEIQDLLVSIRHLLHLAEEVKEGALREHQERFFVHDHSLERVIRFEGRLVNFFFHDALSDLLLLLLLLLELR